jgi:sensor domain CHASE-containing protein
VTRRLKDNGPLIAALVAVVIAGMGWVRSDGGRSQQLSDLTQQVSRLEQQVSHMQQSLDQYLLIHDGH